MEWKSGVGGEEAGSEVIFEHANGTFCGVAAVEIRRNQLKVGLLVGDGGLGGG